ncbi:MAG: WbqC family protein [Bacteroidales bacterium]
MDNILVSSAYLAPTSYYIALYNAKSATIEQYENYIKQSYRNRCTIGGANGTMNLSIPIEKPANGKAHMRDIRISEHGNWRHLHWNALISAYRSTPFFEYYADDFAPLYEKRVEFLLDFNEQIREIISSYLNVETPITLTSEYIDQPTSDTLDLRERIDPKKEIGLGAAFETKPYYQVFSSKYGFQPNLSIVDLLFNMGPEGELILRDSIL